MNFLIVIPGYGGIEWEKKSECINTSIGMIMKTTPINSTCDIKIFNYDSSPNKFNFEKYDMICESGILGEYIYQYITPTLVSKYDYVILLLDDVMTQDNFNLELALKYMNDYNLDLISPSLTLDSIHTHKETLVQETKHNRIGRICNFVEFFLYIIKSDKYTNYYSLFNSNTKWMWGIDYCMDSKLKMGILDSMNIKHHISSNDNNNNMMIRQKEVMYCLQNFKHIFSNEMKKQYVIYNHMYSTKKILLYGGNGWIGRMFNNYLKSNTSYEVVLGQSRIDNFYDTLKEIYDVQPHCVISFTGRTHGTYKNVKMNSIDYLEMPEKLNENMRDNFIGPINLARICNEFNIQNIYIGTGCIYTYTDDIMMFDENQPPNFFGSSYSIIKGYTDKEIRNYKTSLNLRIRMPISYENNERNFINKITSYENICSIQNSMTVLEDMFPIITRMILLNTTGTFNMTNPGTIENNEILEMYKKNVNPLYTWKNMTIEEQRKLLKSERSNNMLDTSKLVSFCNNNNIELKNINKSLEKLFLTYTN